jgi:hypothetical protein
LLGRVSHNDARLLTHQEGFCGLGGLCELCVKPDFRVAKLYVFEQGSHKDHKKHEGHKDQQGVNSNCETRLFA